MSSFETDLTFEDGLPCILDIGPKFDDAPELLITIATDALRAMKIIISYFRLDDTQYYVDMVFYNKILKAYVLIELKNKKTYSGSCGANEH